LPPPCRFFVAASGGERLPGRLKRGGGNVKILLPITESQALAGRGEQINATAGPRESAKEPAAM